MEVHDFKYNKVPIFARKTGNINTLMFAVPKLAFQPASRYQCDVTWSYHTVLPSFIKIERRFRWGSMTLNITACHFLLKKLGISILRCLLSRN